jgi:aspartate racemase
MGEEPMRLARLGLLGGTSWESTLEYYRMLNQATNRLLGGLSTVEIVLWSLDFGAIWHAKERKDFTSIGKMFDMAARDLLHAGVELLAICSNSGHQRADAVEAATGLPVVNIIDATGEELRRLGVRRVGLLGTLETMQGQYYRDRLLARFGMETVVPSPNVQTRVHEIAVNEVARGIRLESSRDDLARVVDGLSRQGADAVILGCTELPLIAPAAAPVPLLDTISIHVEEIVRRARLNGERATPSGTTDARVSSPRPD